jgi:hypothetical protein
MENFGFRSVQTAEEWRKWIRLHVKAIASEISDHAGRRAETVLGDSAHARPLMESAVAVVSRYLASKGEPLRPGRTRTLLRASFRRKLRRCATKLNRREMLAGTNDVEEAVVAFQNCGPSVGLRMNPVRVVRLLSDKSRAILGLRDVGYNWKEIAHFLGMSESDARKTFREELRTAVRIADQPDSRQAELPEARRSHRDEMHNEVAPFTEPIWE